jgi:hypothetical protein
MPKRHAMMTREPKETRGESEAQQLQDTARKIFQVPKSGITKKNEKVWVQAFSSL